MKWVNKFRRNGLEYQEDEVGNIVQPSGAVQPKACQKCKRLFKSEIKGFDIEQDVPLYTCKDCDFENAAGDATLMHKLDKPSHTLKIIKRKRVIGIEKKIIGLIAKITKTKNDVIILCDNCVSD